MVTGALAVAPWWGKADSNRPCQPIPGDVETSGCHFLLFPPCCVAELHSHGTRNENHNSIMKSSYKSLRRSGESNPFQLASLPLLRHWRAAVAFPPYIGARDTNTHVQICPSCNRACTIKIGWCILCLTWETLTLHPFTWRSGDSNPFQSYGAAVADRQILGDSESHPQFSRCQAMAFPPWSPRLHEAGTVSSKTT